MWSPRGSAVADGRRGLTLLYVMGDLGSGQYFLLPARAVRQKIVRARLDPLKARQLDLLREHAYVVRSTAIPTLPAAPADAAHTQTASFTPSFTSFSSLNASHTQVDTQQPGAVEDWRGIGGGTSIAWASGSAERSKGVAETTDGKSDKSIE